MSDKIFATKDDIGNLNKALLIVKKQDQTDETNVDWENVEIHETLHRLIYNIGQFGNWYKKVSKEEKKWYDAVCGNCGWWGSSEYCNGGGAIADTGDYEDPTCPVCNSNHIE